MIDSTLSEAIAMYEGVTKGRVYTIRKIPGGTANDVYLINLSFILRYRLPNKTDEVFYSGSGECNILTKLPTTIAPELYAFDKKYGHILIRYIQEGEIKEERDASFRLYRGLLDTLKLLHGTNIPENCPEFEPFWRYETYRRLAETTFDEAYEDPILEKASTAFARSKKVLCHNNLQRGNFIFDELSKSIKLIDFEFAGSNAEIFDIASLLCENEIEGRLKERLINYYYGVNQVTNTLLEDIDAVIAFEDLLWYYWAEARYKETMNQAFFDIAKAKMARIRKARKKPR